MDKRVADANSMVNHTTNKRGFALEVLKILVTRVTACDTAHATKSVNNFIGSNNANTFIGSHLSGCL